MGVRVMMELLPDKKNVVVFDTSFHQTMEPKAYMYAFPYEDYEELKVRKYGAHGTSHRYVSEIAAQMLGKKDSKIIVCHLGNGASITAVKNGKVDGEVKSYYENGNIQGILYYKNGFLIYENGKPKGVRY